jgi:UDP-N-acetylmuramate--alanine ligase
VIFYGFSPSNEVQIRQTTLRKNEFEIEYDGKVSSFSLKLIGKHNLLNAAAAVTMARLNGIDEGSLSDALKTFNGTARRLEQKGERNGVTYIDDYAHHPTEVRATLQALKDTYPDRRIVAIFQPHTYSRTFALLNDFGSSFAQAEVIYILEIYASARESKGSVSSADLVKQIRNSGKLPTKVQYAHAVEDAAKLLPSFIRPGDVVVTLGAGDVWRFHDMISTTSG